MPAKRAKKPLLHYFTDEPVDPVRSKTMSRVRGKDTKPELLLRRSLHAAGARYRLHPKDVPGRPDIAHKGGKIAVFVDGCFWHGCPDHFKLPKTRTRFWQEKIARNQEKREEVLDELHEEGWTVFQWYECELKDQLEPIRYEILDALKTAQET